MEPAAKVFLHRLHSRCVTAFSTCTGMRIFNHIGPAASALVFLCGNVFAGEYAVLSNGFRLHADRHEITGDSVKLYEGMGFTSLPVSQICAYEAEEYTPPAPAAPVAIPAPALPAPSGDLFDRTAKKHG